MNRERLDQALSTPRVRASTADFWSSAMDIWLTKIFRTREPGSDSDDGIGGKAFTSIASGIMLQEYRKKMADGLDTNVFTKEIWRKLCLSTIHARPTLLWAAAEHSRRAAWCGWKSRIRKLPTIETRSTSPPRSQPVAQRFSGSECTASASVVVLRHICRMEMQEYIDKKIAKALAAGPWGYAMNHGQTKLQHSPGGGNIAAPSTDALRVRNLCDSVIGHGDLQDGGKRFAI
jgi:hypothetical protein